MELDDERVWVPSEGRYMFRSEIGASNNNRDRLIFQDRTNRLFNDQLYSFGQISDTAGHPAIKTLSDRYRIATTTQSQSRVIGPGEERLTPKQQADLLDAQHRRDPNWLYHNWDWKDWPPEARIYWIDKWKSAHSSFTNPVLYAFLRRNEYGSDWYHINTYLSQNPDYPTLPDPNDQLNMTYERNKINLFYGQMVPEAGAMWDWYKQYDKNLGFSRNAILRAYFYLPAPDKLAIFLGVRTKDEVEDVLDRGTKKIGDIVDKGLNNLGDKGKKVIDEYGKEIAFGGVLLTASVIGLAVLSSNIKR